MKTTFFTLLISLLLSACGMSYVPVTGRIGLPTAQKEGNLLVNSGSMPCTLHIRAADESLTCSEKNYGLAAHSNSNVLKMVNTLRSEVDQDYSVGVKGEIEGDVINVVSMEITIIKKNTPSEQGAAATVSADQSLDSDE